MNSSKKINVNYSSLVGLKAELLRKQTEVKDAKVNTDATASHGKYEVKKKKPKVKKLKIDKELIDTDDIKAHKKSKLMLEAKSRLYESLKKSHSNKNEHFLVDFENKSESEDEILHSDDYEDANSDPEEDWVEYEDCFGRTRKCLRKDLPKMQEKDDFVKHEVMKKSETDLEPQDIRPEIFKIIPKEPEIEIMRRKWEEQTEKLAEKMNIHYQDVLFDEARAHGVGYYEFSQDEEVRAKQQRNLETLRKETIQKQKEMQNLKEMRNKMEQNRLKAARIRQRIRAGLPPEPSEEELKEDEPNTEADAQIKEIDETEEKKVVESKEQSSLADIENKIKAFGELLGKRTQWHEMSQEEWVHKRRKDRINEFAPVYSDFKSAGYLETGNEDSTKNSNVDRESIENTATTSDYVVETICNIDTESNSNDSDIIGPMPLRAESPKPLINKGDNFLDLPEDVRSELSNIDFTKPPPNMRVGSLIGDSAPIILPTPVPPPNPTELPLEFNLQSSELSSDNPDGQTLQHNLDENKITAGLKFLRANFEQQKYS